MEGSRTRRHDWIGLAAFLALCFVIAGIGGAVTARSVGTWYQSLTKPTFNPPDSVFGPVWTLLYIMVAVAGWRVWRAHAAPEKQRAMAAYFVQLALNLGWSLIFFGARMIAVAAAEILLLLVTIAVTVVLFWRIDGAAAWLLVPYAAWVAFASVLNVALWRLN